MEVVEFNIRLIPLPLCTCWRCSLRPGCGRAILVQNRTEELLYLIIRQFNRDFEADVPDSLELCPFGKSLYIHTHPREKLNNVCLAELVIRIAHRRQRIRDRFSRVNRSAIDAVLKAAPTRSQKAG